MCGVHVWVYFVRWSCEFDCFSWMACVCDLFWGATVLILWNDRDILTFIVMSYKFENLGLAFETERKEGWGCVWTLCSQQILG